MPTNSEIVRAYFDAINAKDLALANSMVAEECMMHSGDDTVSYSDAIQAEQEGWKDNPNRKYVIDELLAEGDKVAGRWTILNDGSAPTFEMLSIWDMQDGKFVHGKHATFRSHQ